MLGVAPPPLSIVRPNEYFMMAFKIVIILIFAAAHKAMRTSVSFRRLATTSINQNKLFDSMIIIYYTYQIIKMLSVHTFNLVINENTLHIYIIFFTLTVRKMLYFVEATNLIIYQVYFL